MKEIRQTRFLAFQSCDHFRGVLDRINKMNKIQKAETVVGVLVFIKIMFILLILSLILQVR